MYKLYNLLWNIFFAFILSEHGVVYRQFSYTSAWEFIVSRPRHVSFLSRLEQKKHIKHRNNFFFFTFTFDCSYVRSELMTRPTYIYIYFYYKIFINDILVHDTRTVETRLNV